MNPGMENPFESIESAQEFVTLLAASPSRRLDALRLCETGADGVRGHC